MLLTTQIEIKITKANINYYKEKGYTIKEKDIITINTEDLQPQSDKRVKYKCDECGEIIELSWASYLKKKKKDYSVWGDFCEKCNKKKRAEWLKQKDSFSYKQNYLNRQKKRENTCLQKYGTDNIMKTEEGKKALKESIHNKYGVDNIMELPETRIKIAKTLGSSTEIEVLYSKNGKEHYKYKGVPCSNNQKHLYDLFDGELNYFYKYYTLDLFFKELNIYLEYNGTGHNLSVIMGKKTLEEQEKQELKRYYILKNLGLKQITFSSLKTKKLPPDNVLLYIFKVAKEYLKQENNNWITFDFDNSLIKTKDKTFNYNFYVEDIIIINEI